MRSERGPGRRGYSLIEVMAATALLLGVALTLVLLIGAGLRMGSSGQERTLGAEIANEFLEAVRRQGYLTIPPQTLVFDGRTPDAAVDGFPPAPYPFRVDAPAHRLVVETQQLAPNLRRVRVTVHSRSAISRLESYFHP